MTLGAGGGTVTSHLVMRVASFGLLAAFLAACTLDRGGTRPEDAPAAGATGGVAGSSAGGNAGIGAGGSAAAAGVGGVPDASIDASGGTAGLGDAGVDVADAAPDASDASDAAVDAGCPTGTKSCGGVCVSEDDPATGCANPTCDPCSRNGGTSRCALGECALESCDAGLADCNGDASDGCEVELGADAAHCGACGAACVVPNAVAACIAGSCEVAGCDPGFDDCNTDPVDGCEVDTRIDPSHCGACATPCMPASGRDPVCAGGVCGEFACADNTADCDGDGACETTLTTDASHCGFCGNACDLHNATARCSNGECIVDACLPAFGDCDNVDANGCETNLGVSALACGSCNRACSTNDVITARCVAGLCDPTCAPGFDDCTQPPAPASDDGCETPTDADPQNCGGCGVACDLANATSECTDSKCEVKTCDPGFGDCDLDPAGGCEISLDDDQDHCGACGRPCATAQVEGRACALGLCAPTCLGSFGNCNKPPAPEADDGCEVDFASSVEHCGGCDRACSTKDVLSLACEGGLCTSTCIFARGNCSTPSAPTTDDGCEANTATSSAHCGGCGNDCSLQGGGTGFSCRAPQDGECGCGNVDDKCRQSGSGGTCKSNGRCECSGIECAAGETCVTFGIDVCSCNLGAPCSAAFGEACCAAIGCVNTANDPAHCGGCNRACPPSFACALETCICASHPACDAGTPGTCDVFSGRCSCGGSQCAPGERCTPDGTCG